MAKISRKTQRPPLIAILCFVMALANCAAIPSEKVDASNDRIVLILGVPTKVELDGPIDTPPNTNGIDLPMGSLYRVRLDSIKSIHGQFDANSLEVTIAATHDPGILKKKEIFIVLQIVSGESNVLHWGRPRMVACIPSNLVTEFELVNSMPFQLSGVNSRCTNTEWFN